LHNFSKVIKFKSVHALRLRAANIYFCVITNAQYIHTHTHRMHMVSHRKKQQQ